jgi:hypothetical protein
MSLDEELQEHAEHAKAPFDRRVAATMAIIAAALAVVSVLGHICTTEEIILQQRAADQWAFSQAKNVRRYISEVAVDLLRNSSAAAADSEKYRKNVDRYERETDESQKSARELETDRDLRHRQAVRLHIGEVFLEIAIVFASLAILAKRPMLWWMSIIGSGVGLAIAATTAALK